MTLSDWYGELSEEERLFRFGRETNRPLTSAFPRKRVVHPGLNGTVIAPGESQQIWNTIMSRTPEAKNTQTAYIHIPFCKTKCLYCAFFQNGCHQEEEDRYVDCLVKEIEAAADTPRMQGGLLHAIFIGGGTPTALSVPNVRRLLTTIQTRLPLANDCELTLEGRINDVTEDKIETWLSCGVNRVSLGVQSFHTDIRKQVGRIDDEDTVFQRLATLASYNQCAVIVDLMYGLPGQDMRIWEEDLERLVESAADGADLYQLNVFEESDLHRAIVAGRLTKAATTEEQAEMFAFARDYMEKRAYRRLNICHWSRSNRERSLYNTLARSGATLFPFGCGAGGSVDGYGTMLHRALMPYQMFVEQGEKPFMGLMKESELQNLVNIVQTQTEQGYLNIDTLVAVDSRMEDLRWLYDLWEERGLVENNGVLYTLTVAGQFWQVNITQTTLECIRYLATGDSDFALEKVSAQDERRNPRVEAVIRQMQEMKASGKGHSLATMKAMAEAMRKMSPADIQEVMRRMRNKS